MALCLPTAAYAQQARTSHAPRGQAALGTPTGRPIGGRLRAADAPYWNEGGSW